MKTPATPCPRCNSNQSFAVLRRPTTLPLTGVIEKYVRCNMCRWEILLSYTTQQLETVTARKNKLVRRAHSERHRYGTAFYSTRTSLYRTSQAVSSLTLALSQQVQEARDATRVDADSA